PGIIRHKKKVALICARMNGYQKRISLALKAWEQIQKHGIAEEWTLKIVGTGPDLEEYKELVAQKNIKNIQFCGRRNPEPYYDEASIFLMTSGPEGWGLTLTESLQNGVVPVVMNTSPVFEDIITNGYNGFLTRGSRIGDFIKHVLILMEDRRRLEAMQQNALNSASRFTLASTMQKWRGIIPPALS
ncbi:MAG: glycosyltransferase, partial [Muribaculaceae bacterium]|nr:glycosyltransferase [Muribaculaceae bacterium]